MKLRVYLSGAMTGMPELNFPAFHAAAARLRAQGWDVVNPAELDAQDDKALTWTQYLRRDIRALVECDAIAMLPGWEKSRGATLEHHIASALGMPVVPQGADPVAPAMWRHDCPAEGPLEVGAGEACSWCGAGEPA